MMNLLKSKYIYLLDYKRIDSNSYSEQPLSLAKSRLSPSPISNSNVKKVKHNSNSHKEMEFTTKEKHI